MAFVRAVRKKNGGTTRKADRRLLESEGGDSAEDPGPV
jgi:hypothetical protein